MDHQVPDQETGDPPHDEKDAEKGEMGRGSSPNGRPSTRTASASEHDKYVVDWDGPDDSDNPTNWSNTKKWKNLLIVNSITLIT